jgi:hypothetical protein
MKTYDLIKKGESYTFGSIVTDIPFKELRKIISKRIKIKK